MPLTGGRRERGDVSSPGSYYISQPPQQLPYQVLSGYHIYMSEQHQNGNTGGANGANVANVANVANGANGANVANGAHGNVNGNSGQLQHHHQPQLQQLQLPLGYEYSPYAIPAHYYTERQPQESPIPTQGRHPLSGMKSIYTGGSDLPTPTQPPLNTMAGHQQLPYIYVQSNPVMSNSVDHEMTTVNTSTTSATTKGNFAGFPISHMENGEQVQTKLSTSTTTNSKGRNASLGYTPEGGSHDTQRSSPMDSPLHLDTKENYKSDIQTKDGVRNPPLTNPYLSHQLNSSMLETSLNRTSPSFATNSSHQPAKSGSNGVFSTSSNVNKISNLLNDDDDDNIFPQIRNNNNNGNVITKDIDEDTRANGQDLKNDINATENGINGMENGYKNLDQGKHIAKHANDRNFIKATLDHVDQKHEPIYLKLKRGRPLKIMNTEGNSSTSRKRDRVPRKIVKPTKTVVLRMDADKLREITNLGDGSRDRKEMKNEELMQACESNLQSTQLLQVTEEQIDRLNHRNNPKSPQELIQLKKALPNAIKISDNEVPIIPRGYIPLVMAPDGTLIPMELVNINPKSSFVSILRPIWDRVDAKSSDTDTNSHYIGHEKKERDGVFFEFNNADKCASLSLYLLSKESACKLVYPKFTGDRKFQREIVYYNRLIEREKLEIFSIYKRERNKLSRLLEKLDVNLEQTDYDIDLMEMRDYELLREELSYLYEKQTIEREYSSNVRELKSVQYLDYSSRLLKFKNYLNVENERLRRHKNRLCRINHNKCQSIWNKYIKSGGMRNRHSTGMALFTTTATGTNTDSNNSSSGGIASGSNCGTGGNEVMTYSNLESSFISDREFILLTNPNSRSYATYVLNNSMDKGNKNQNEIVGLIDYYLDENSTLMLLYEEVKRRGYTFNEKTRNVLINKNKKKDMISEYGLTKIGVNTSSRILRELQIDGMNVDLKRNERIERRSVGQRNGRPRKNSVYNANSVNVSTFSSNTHHDSSSDSNNYLTTDNNDNISNDHKQVSWSTSASPGSNGAVVVEDLEHPRGGTQMPMEMNLRRELNITSSLDKSLCDVDRVKMLNLNREEIGASYTKVYGMPSGLTVAEINSDLSLLRWSAQQSSHKGETR